jgi:hypothetical protein
MSKETWREERRAWSVEEGNSGELWELKRSVFLTDKKKHG